jgi:hypothetical protein
MRILSQMRLRLVQRGSNIVQTGSNSSGAEHRKAFTAGWRCNVNIVLHVKPVLQRGSNIEKPSPPDWAVMKMSSFLASNQPLVIEMIPFPLDHPQGQHILNPTLTHKGFTFQTPKGTK